MKKEQEFMGYFDYEEEFPGQVAYDILPLGIFWGNISSTFLNGFINYVEPISIFVMDRYVKWDENISEYREVIYMDPPFKTSWKKFEGKKGDLYKVACEEGRFYHTNLSMFGDDILLLAKVKKEERFGISIETGKFLYYFFCFDQDVSNCSIGRFLTINKENVVIERFKKHVKENASKNNEGQPKELPTYFLKGWLSF